MDKLISRLMFAVKTKTDTDRLLWKLSDNEYEFTTVPLKNGHFVVGLPADAGKDISPQQYTGYFRYYDSSGRLIMYLHSFDRASRQFERLTQMYTSARANYYRQSPTITRICDELEHL